MNAEPSDPGGLRTLLSPHVTRTRGLVALGLLSLSVGLGIVSRIGSAADGAPEPSPPRVSAAAPRVDSFESRVIADDVRFWVQLGC